MPRDQDLPAKDGRFRPRYWHCDAFYRVLEKGIRQPWFRPFGQAWDARTLPSFSLHREALKAIIDPEVHDRSDTWYMREDGSNLEENVRDITSAVMNLGLDFLDQVHDPRLALGLLDRGSLVPSPTSPHAAELRQLIRLFLGEEGLEAPDGAR
jgi:hypothetical protein